MTKEVKKPKVIHRMSDGTIRDSIEGFKVPADNYAYQILADYQNRELKKLAEKKAKAV